MEEDLKKIFVVCLTQLERRPQEKWKTTSKKQNGRQPQKRLINLIGCDTIVN